MSLCSGMALSELCSVSSNPPKHLHKMPRRLCGGFPFGCGFAALRNCEEIDDSQNCQMSNVCCAMSDELVKRPTDKMTWCFDNYIKHRTTDIRHLTSWAGNFFTAPMTAHNVETERSRAVREAQARQRAASRNRPPLQFCRSTLFWEIAIPQ